MKVVITDYPDTMGRNLAYEEAILKRGFPGCETICYLYRGDKEEMKRLVSDADAVLTAFLYFDKKEMKNPRPRKNGALVKRK